MADPIKPVSRLEDASLANSNAIAEARQAATSERQDMLADRGTQRAYRRAVRHRDYQAIATLGSYMNKIGLSRGGGGGIQSAKGNDRIASDRAFNRADQLNQAAGRGGVPPVNPEPEGETETITMNGVDYQMPKKAPGSFSSGSVAQGAANDIERATGGSTGQETVNPNSRPAGSSYVRQSRLLPENNPAPSSKSSIVGDTRQKFIADLGKSQLFKDGNADAIERAATRGSKFGISREQIDAYWAGEDATPSGIAEAKRKVAERGTTEILGPELPPADSPAVSLAKSIQKEQKGIAEGIDNGIKGIEKLQTNSFVNSLLDPVVPEPPVTRSPKPANATSSPKPVDVTGAPKAVLVNETPESPAASSPEPSFLTKKDRKEWDASQAKKEWNKGKENFDRKRVERREYNEIAESLIRDKAFNELPDWQKTNVVGSFHQKLKENKIRSAGIDPVMDAQIKKIMADRAKVKEAYQYSQKVREQVSNLFPQSSK